MVDPSAFAPFDFAQSYGRGQQLRMNQVQMQSQMEDRENQKRLRDLLPQAVHGDQAAIDQIAGINPQLFMHLDDRQRQQAKAELADVAGAVRWAMSDPNQKAQRWNQVVDFYSQHVPQISQYRDHPEMAESALVQLGQIGTYLDSQPKPEYKAIEAGGSLIDVSGGNPRVVIAPNPGGYTTGAPVGGGPQPGQVVNGFRFKGGNPNDRNSWEQVGGPSPGGSGGFL